MHFLYRRFYIRKTDFIRESSRPHHHHRRYTDTTKPLPVWERAGFSLAPSPFLWVVPCLTLLLRLVAWNLLCAWLRLVSRLVSLMYIALKLPPYFTIPPFFFSRSGSQIAAHGGENRWQPVRWMACPVLFHHPHHHQYQLLHRSNSPLPSNSMETRMTRSTIKTDSKLAYHLTILIPCRLFLRQM